MEKADQEIFAKGRDIIKGLLEMDPAEEDFNVETFDIKRRQALIAMQYKRDSEQSRRIEQGQIIRVIFGTIEDSKERQDYIKLSMPALLPAVSE